MMTSRREFLGTLAAGTAGLASASPDRGTLHTWGVGAGIIKPRRLERGDTVGIINPGSVTSGPFDLADVRRALSQVGLHVKEAPHLAGDSPDEQRVREIHALFADAGVKALIPVRGGWGCARLLQYLDYDLIRSRPKILIGYSDVAALLVGIHSLTGLVTFHGPMGNSDFVPFAVEQMKRVLFDGEAVTMTNPAGNDAWSRTITPGRARGRLLGGNLTVLASMVGSPYLRHAAEDTILFLEEVREPVSEVDRMLTQLQLAGILERVKGVVFGQCTRCSPPQADGTLTLDRVLDERLKPLGIPAWRGALIGHIDGQFTVPIGVSVEMDATERSIQLLEPAVV